MAERVLWTFSPDGKSMLVVADPGGVENEPVPNGFFFGDESRGFQTQMDSVWDVAPSPDWKWIGFGRAYSVVGGAGTGTDQLAEVSRRTSIDTATLRAGGAMSRSWIAIASSSIWISKIGTWSLVRAIRASW